MFLRNFLHLYIQMLKLMVVIACLRLICLLFVRNEWVFSDAVSAFIMGLRFDLLVLSFILIPGWVLLLVFEYTSFKMQAGKALRVYWRIASGSAMIIWIGNIFYFSHQHQWMWMSQWKARIEQETLLTVIISACVILILYLFRQSRFLFWNVRLVSNFSSKGKRKSSNEPQSVSLLKTKSSWQAFAVVMISAILLALGARGTLTPHHLRFEHSLVSENAKLNKWALSPLWTATKDR